MELGAGRDDRALPADELACPICVELIEDPFATPCGHTFCFRCISTHLRNRSNCPSCGAHLVQDSIHPNFLLSKVRCAVWEAVTDSTSVSSSHGCCCVLLLLLQLLPLPLSQLTCCACLPACLTQLLKQAAAARPPSSLASTLLAHVRQELDTGGRQPALQELDAAIALLQQRRATMMTAESSDKLQLLLLFLEHAK